MKLVLRKLSVIFIDHEIRSLRMIGLLIAF